MASALDGPQITDRDDLFQRVQRRRRELEKHRNDSWQQIRFAAPGHARERPDHILIQSRSEVHGRKSA
jgi:hypothetical protein